MPRHPSRLALLLAGSALLGSAGLGWAAPSPAAAAGRTAVADDLALVAARERSANADAAVDALRRNTSPAHVAEPLPGVDHGFGLETLRAEYLDVQRKVAGYRATLGEQHPTLVAAEQMLGMLRAQVLDATRGALTGAERQAAEARAAVAAAERRKAADAAGHDEATDAVSAAAPRTVIRDFPPVDRDLATGSVPAATADAPVERDTVTGRAAAPRPVAATPPDAGPTDAAALALLAALAGLGGAWGFARRPARRADARRVEPAMAREPAALPAPAPPALPVLATFALATDAAGRLTGAAPAGGLLAAASALHGTLRAALGDAPGTRLTVLVVPVAGLSGAEADVVGLTLAAAAAAAGRRPALMEARSDGRLRAALVPPEASPMLVEAGGATRTLYRLGEGAAAVAALPSDPGEAEAAADAARRPNTVRLRGLDAFDTVILLGGDIETMARGVDAVIAAAPADLAPATRAAVARDCSAAGRPCGAVLVVRAATAPAVAAAGRAVRGAAPALAMAGRFGLRGSIDPSRPVCVG